MGRVGRRKQNRVRDDGSMLSTGEPVSISPDCTPSEISAKAAVRKDAPSLDKLEALLDICEHAIVSEDLGEFLHKAAEILRDSYNYDLVQIWTLGSRSEELLLSSSVPRVLKEPIVGRAIPSLREEARGKESAAHDENGCSQQIM